MILRLQATSRSRCSPRHITRKTSLDRSGIEHVRLPQVRRLTTDFSLDNRRPYFLFDEDLSVAELRQRLSNGNSAERLRLIAKMLREAHEDDVWEFLTLKEFLDIYPEVSSLLGRRREYWQQLYNSSRRSELGTTS